MEYLPAAHARTARERERHSDGKIGRSETSAPPPWKPGRGLSPRLAAHPWRGCVSSLSARIRALEAHGEVWAAIPAESLRPRRGIQFLHWQARSGRCAARLRL